MNDESSQPSDQPASSPDLGSPPPSEGYWSYVPQSEAARRVMEQRARKHGRVLPWETPAAEAAPADASAAPATADDPPAAATVPAETSHTPTSSPRLTRRRGCLEEWIDEETRSR